MENTFIIPVIRTDLIERCLETLYKNTPPNFYVYLIDQTPEGLDHKALREMYNNLLIIRTPKTLTHHKGNLGFAKATNLGISLVETPYFTMCNDDVEFVNRAWWWGVMETFNLVDSQTPERPCMMVNPAAIRLPDWSVGRPAGDHCDILPYKLRYSQDEYDTLLNGVALPQERYPDLYQKDEQGNLLPDQDTIYGHYINQYLTLMPGSVIDGVTMYCSVFKTSMFLEVGFLNEKFYPGGGEDYDYNCRANMYGYRCVGTTNSWVWHWWSKSIGDEKRAEIEATQDAALRWNNNHELWGENFDIWGIKDMKKEDIPPITLKPL